MKKFIPLMFVLITLIACAGAEKKMNMVDDLGSPEKVALLSDRAHEFWTATIGGDFEKTYEIYDPFFRANFNKHWYLLRTGKIIYHEYEIKDIKVEGNVGKVTLRTKWSMDKLKFKSGQTEGAEEVPAEFVETWLYIYDNWYKEYYFAMIEKGSVYY